MIRARLYTGSRRRGNVLNLRPYQLEARDMLYEYLGEHDGHPCVVLPTGSGKSVCIADLCRELPEARILILTHVKELIEQNYKKLVELWPFAPAGIYSAGIGRREISSQILVAGIQSIHRKAAELGRVDIIIVDEAHLISHENAGMYRKFLSQFPEARVIGYTATPFRMGHGLITDKPALFDALIEPPSASVGRLIADGYLAKLRSKSTPTRLSTDGVAKRGGEYIESELQKAVNTQNYNSKIVSDVLERAGDRKAWLFFCAGVAHAEAMAEALRSAGINAACVTGETKNRDEILFLYKSGKIRALTNANVLTTGFDYPDIDLIAFCRPTMSPGLYIQMAGRGLRLKSHTDHCLCLDFAGVVAMHGPIDDVITPMKRNKGDGIAPSKECPQCFEIIAAQSRVCPSCGFEFPKPEPGKDLYLRENPILNEPVTINVAGWKIEKHVARSSGKNVLRVAYYSNGGDMVEEYLCIWHQGQVGARAQSVYKTIMDHKRPPDKIKYIRDGKFKRVLNRIWLTN